MRRLILSALLAAAAVMPTSALAWGREGHAVIAQIARGYLTPKAAAAVDAMLASDPDTLTPPDLGARASWADAWRKDHRETTEWHFVDTELDQPDLAAACFGFPASATPASAGPEKDCVVGRIDAFARELADPKTDAAERLLALKFLLHFVGDLHQPLHAADNQDRGGNCVPLALGGPRTVNLHSYWDTVAVEAIDPDADRLARTLAAEITPAQRKVWEQGDARTWALESFAIAKASVYTVGSKPGCATDAAPVALPEGYGDTAKRVVAEQLKKAGVRLALELNRALG
ncbi:S1/P1 nuclease [Caulobacter sp. 602-1]|uniref:S1/P1 nuclease n=1 Tax=Caulobacter sp. 602-1 TaxID=2492472 RepID=UPI000F637F25|nr:S1/P1 nuclease [Caulobacter sp. 602-1]RRN63491.1 S1/P1 Nuclease [Caulobacter sp. 602-1]